MKAFAPHSHNRGFTLVELLVVIVVVAVLALVVILVLNPSELLRRARDSNRISDMASLRTSLALYLANVSSPNLASSTNGYGRCYITAATTSCAFGFSTFPATNSTSSATSTAVNSTGWLPVDMTQIASGAPLASLPIDPVNNSTCFYGYVATSTNLTYKLIASCMESVKYGGVGSGYNVLATDGGSFPNVYELGTNLSL